MNATTRTNLLPWVMVALLAVPVSMIYWHHTDPMGASRYYDFEQCYYLTARDVVRGGASALKPHFDNGSFMNVPIAAWVLAPLGWLDRPSADRVFALLSIVSVLGTLVLLMRVGTTKTAPFLCLMFLLNGPLWYSLLVGNTTQIVLLCLVAALVLWGRRNGYAAGCLIGIAAVIKPMLVLFGLYFILKKEWRVVAGGATVIIGSLAGSIAVAGFDITLYWYQHTLAAFAGRPMPAYNVQSIESFILRLSERPSSVANWYPHDLSVWEKLARDLVFLALFSLVGLGVWFGRTASLGTSNGQPSSRAYLEFSLVLTLCVITSTVSWTHYYLLLLLPYALYFTGNLPLKEDRLTRYLIWPSLVFCSMPVHRLVFASSALESMFFKSFQSIWLFGGLLLFWALIRGALSSVGEKARVFQGLANRPHIQQVALFLLAGGTATVVQYCALVALVESARINPTLAAVAAYLCGAMTSYLLNFRFTFTNSGVCFRRGLVKFLVVNVIGLGLNTLIFVMLRHLDAYYLLAQAVATGLVLIWNYTAARLFVFRRGADAPELEYDFLSTMSRK